jgi:hypothetical protein
MKIHMHEHVIAMQHLKVTTSAEITEFSSHQKKKDTRVCSSCLRYHAGPRNNNCRKGITRRKNIYSHSFGTH